MLSPTIPLLNRARVQLLTIAIALAVSQLHVAQATIEPTPADTVAADLIQVVQKQSVA